jgi:uncharacterized protein
MNKFLVFDVSKLIDQSTGSRDEYSFEGPVKFEGMTLKAPVTGHVEIMKIEEGVNVNVTNLETKAEFTCDRCLKLYTQPILVKSAERIFHKEPPKNVEDLSDLYMMNKKHLNVDISEMLRQEIILHFPLNLVCSSGCKGLCTICGKDKNKGTCKCKVAEVEEYKPLSKLKELLK